MNSYNMRFFHLLFKIRLFGIEIYRSMTRKFKVMTLK